MGRWSTGISFKLSFNWRLVVLYVYGAGCSLPEWRRGRHSRASDVDFHVSSSTLTSTVNGSSWTDVNMTVRASTLLLSFPSPLADRRQQWTMSWLILKCVKMCLLVFRCICDNSLTFGPLCILLAVFFLIWLLDFLLHVLEVSENHRSNHHWRRSSGKITDASSASTSASVWRAPRPQTTSTFCPLFFRLSRQMSTEPRVLWIGGSWTSSSADFFFLSFDLSLLEPDLTEDWKMAKTQHSCYF